MPIVSKAVRPSLVLTSFDPEGGYPGDVITVTGSGFVGTMAVFLGLAGGPAPTVECDDVTVISATELTFVVPDDALTTILDGEFGDTYPRVLLTNETGTVNSGGDRFTPQERLPIVDSFLPTSGEVGEEVVITGSNFFDGGSEDIEGITVNGTAVTVYTVDSDTQITMEVPVGATSGPIEVENSVGFSLNEDEFTVESEAAAPVVTSYDVNHGEPGDEIVVTGTGFTGTTDVTVCGVEATFVENSDTQLTVTVPEGPNRLGVINVVNALGNDDGPAFTLDNFWFDLTQASLPPGLTAVRSPTPLLYAADGAGVVLAYAGADIAEDAGDGQGKGRFSFPAYAGPADPKDFVTGWGLTALTRAAGAAAGPDGVAASATKLTDASGATTGRALLTGPTISCDGLLCILWHRDDAGDVPTSSPLVGVMGAYLDSFCGPVFRSVGWRKSVCRVSAGVQVYTRYLDLRLVGSVPSGGLQALDPIPGQQATFTDDVTKLGSIYVGLYQVQALRRALLPIAVGSTGAADYTIDPALLPLLVAPGTGYFQFELDILTDQFLRQQGAPAGAEDWVFSVGSAGGTNGVYWSNGSIVRVLNGSADASVNCEPLASHPVRIIGWVKSGARGTRAEINGCWGPDAGNVGISISAPTTAKLGSKLGTDHGVARYRTLKRSTRDLNLCEGVGYGASNTSDFSASVQAVLKCVYAGLEALERDGIITYAVAGETAAQQAARWTGTPVGTNPAPQRGDARVKWIFVGGDCLRNSISVGQTAAQVAVTMTAWVLDMRTQNPGAVVIIGPPQPTGASLDAGEQAHIDTINAAVLADAYGDTEHLALWTSGGSGQLGNANTSAGADTVLTAYDSGDGLHYTQEGRLVMAAALRAKLIALALL